MGIKELEIQRRQAMIEMLNAAFRLQDSNEYRAGFTIAMHFIENILQYPELLDELLVLIKTWNNESRGG